MDREETVTELPTTLAEQLEALIIRELNTKSKARFKRAAKVCERAHQLIQMYATSVEASMEVDSADVPQEGYGQMRMANYAAVGVGGHQVQQDERREILSQIVPFLRAMEERERTAKLSNLIELRKMATAINLDVTQIDAQIRELQPKQEPPAQDPQEPEAPRAQFVCGPNDMPMGG